MKSLQELMDFIGARYVFSEEHYPGLVGRSYKETVIFAVNHSVLHMAKSIGRIAAECEAHDHGGDINNDAIHEATIKMFTTS